MLKACAFVSAIIVSPADLAQLEVAFLALWRFVRQLHADLKWSLFPPLFREEGVDLAKADALAPEKRARLVADTIAAMTDLQALRLYQRLTGLSQGSVLDPIIT